MYRLAKFENGLTVATAAMPHMTSVSVGVWVGIGSRYEPASLNGVCHFIEHLLFKGTKRRSAREISQAVEGIGGYLNAFTSEEATCFHARAGHDHFDQLLDVLLDMLLGSTFDPAEVAKEREVIKEEIAMYLDEPQHQVQELLNATLWPGQPLGRPITGTPRTLNRMARAQLVEYLRSNYVAGATVITVAGRLNHRQVVRAVERYLRRFRTAPIPRYTPAHHSQREPRIRLLTKQTEQTQIALGFRACSRHDPRRYALRLLNTILGENSSSRLFQRLREDLGLAYSIYSAPSFFGDAGDFVIYAGLDAVNLPRALKLIKRECQRLRDTAPGAAELRRAREFVIGQIELTLESTESQMNLLGEQMLSYGRIVPPAQIKRQFQKVTAGDIRAAANRFLRPENANLALVSPLAKDTAVRRALIPET